MSRQELGVGFDGEGVVPVFGGLDAQFGEEVDFVVVGQVAVDGVGGGGEEAETEVEFVVPLQAALVVVVGFEHKIGEQGNVVVAAFVPVFGEVVLGELE